MNRDWSTYNQSQSSEKTYFLDMVNQLTQHTQETNFGRPWTNLGEIAKAMILRQYHQKSARRDQANHPNVHYNTLLKYQQSRAMGNYLMRLLHYSTTPIRNSENIFAIDSTGIMTTNFTPYLSDIRGFEQQHDYIKLHACVGTKSNAIYTLTITDKHSSDTSQFPLLIQQMKELDVRMAEVLADKAYCSRLNHDVSNDAGAIPYLLFKNNNTGKAKGSTTYKRMFNDYENNTQEYLDHYHQRSNVEATFYSFKTQFGYAVKSKNFQSQANELVARSIAYNLACIIKAQLNTYKVVA